MFQCYESKLNKSQVHPRILLVPIPTNFWDKTAPHSLGLCFPNPWRGLSCVNGCWWSRWTSQCADPYLPPSPNQSPSPWRFKDRRTEREPSALPFISLCCFYPVLLLPGQKLRTCLGGSFCFPVISRDGCIYRAPIEPSEEASCSCYHYHRLPLPSCGRQAPDLHSLADTAHRPSCRFSREVYFYFFYESIKLWAFWFALAMLTTIFKLNLSSKDFRVWLWICTRLYSQSIYYGIFRSHFNQTFNYTGNSLCWKHQAIKSMFLN